MPSPITLELLKEKFPDQDVTTLQSVLAKSDYLNDRLERMATASCFTDLAKWLKNQHIILELYEELLRGIETMVGALEKEELDRHQIAQIYTYDRQRLVMNLTVLIRKKGLKVIKTPAELLAEIDAE